MSSDTTKLYEILGVSKSATSTEIKKAFHKQSRDGPYKHPDKGGESDKFKILNEAHEILKDEQKRATYDKFGLKGLAEGGGMPEGFDLSDLLGGMGGGMGGMGGFFGMGGSTRAKGPQKGKPQLKEIKITLEESYFGKLYTFSHTRKRNCDECGGKGGKNVRVCSTCKGAKMVTQVINLGPGISSKTTTVCRECSGKGEEVDPKNRCKICKGDKVSNKTQKIEVPIEPGCPHEHVYIQHGEGDEGPDLIAGDLHVKVMLQKHALFRRTGADLKVEKKITLLEALTGFNFTLKHINGETMLISQKPGIISKHFEIRTIRNMGMPFWKDEHLYGNMFIRFDIILPTSLDPDQVKQLKQILPGPKHDPVDPNKEKVNFLQDFEQSDVNAKEGRDSAYESSYNEDNRNTGGMGGGCQQQ